MANDRLSELLRERLRDGATVAELVLVAREAIGPTEPVQLVARAVREAFGLRIGGWTVLSATECVGTGTVRDSKLTWGFLPGIMEGRDRWDTPPEDRLDEPRWYDGLTKTPFADWQSVAETNHGVSPEGWAALGEKDRQAVVNLEMMRLAWSEDLQILAALAEQLQRRVNELEGRHETPNHHPAAAGAA